ncbi:MAG: transposase domain-containing protein [Burkholderia sp.]
MSDGGGAVYDLIANKNKRIHLGYWTHARRYFVEAEEALPKESTSLNLYSLIETCKANNVDVYQYLIDLFKAPPLAQTVDDYEALPPWKLCKPARKPKT